MIRISLRARGPLTKSEWKQILLDAPYEWNCPGYPALKTSERLTFIGGIDFCGVSTLIFMNALFSLYSQIVGKPEVIQKRRSRK